MAGNDRLLIGRSAVPGRGIASKLLSDLLCEYEGFLYVSVVPDEKKNVTFYQNHGFEIMEEGTPLQIKGDSWV